MSNSLSERFNTLKTAEEKALASGKSADTKQSRGPSEVWTDDLLTKMLNKIKRSKKDPTTLMLAISLFWAKYFGYQETKGIGKIIVYILYHIPTTRDLTGFFFKLPTDDLRDDERAKLLEIIPSDEIREMEQEKSWDESKEYDPLTKIGAISQIDPTMVGHHLASEDIQDTTSSDGVSKPGEEGHMAFRKKIIDMVKKYTGKQDSEREGDKKGMSADGYVTNARGLIGITLYIALVCLRRAVKTSIQFHKAFSKPRFSQNYVTLIDEAEELDLYPPHGAFNHYLEKELSRGGKMCSAAFGIVLFNYQECGSRGFNADILIEKTAVKEVSGLLEATCLIHTRANGMALYQMFVNVVEMTSLPLQKLMEMMSFRVTEKGINAVLDFRMHLISGKEVNLIFWSRLISESFHRNLQPDYDRTLAYTLARILDYYDTPDEGTGILQSLWVSKCNPKHVKLGQTISAKIIKSMPDSELEGLTEEARKVAKVPLEEGRNKESAGPRPESALSNHTNDPFASMAEMID